MPWPTIQADPAHLGHVVGDNVERAAKDLARALAQDFGRGFVVKPGRLSQLTLTRADGAQVGMPVLWYAMGWLRAMNAVFQAQDRPGE